LLSTLFATAVSDYLTDHGGGRAVAQAAQVHGYTTAFWWSAAILGAGAVASAVLFRGRSAADATAPGISAAAGDAISAAAEPVALR
jgi:hypothetical protein